MEKENLFKEYHIRLSLVRSYGSMQHDSEGFCFWYEKNDDAYLAGYHRKQIL